MFGIGNKSKYAEYFAKKSSARLCFNVAGGSIVLIYALVRAIVETYGHFCDPLFRHHLFLVLVYSVLQGIWVAAIFVMFFVVVISSARELLKRRREKKVQEPNV